MFKWLEGQQDVIHNTKIKREITSSFARALKVLQQKHLQLSQDEFIYSNDASNNLCSSLEAAFLHGLKDSVAHKLTAYVGLTAAPDPFSNMNFWSVVVKFTHSDVVTQLQSMTQINTEIGLCRAWVRLALNDGLMESYLHSMIVDTKILKHFYHSYSYIRDHEQPGILKNYLTGLMSLEFKLSYNSSVLNYWSSSTLQLIGALDTHRVPSPAVRHSERGLADSVLQKNSKEKDQKNNYPAVTSKDVETASQDRNSHLFANIQNVEDLQQVAAAKSDGSSSLSVSEGSYSSHVSCPDPVVDTAADARVNLLNTRVASQSLFSRSDVDAVAESGVNLSDTRVVSPSLLSKSDFDAATEARVNLLVTKVVSPSLSSRSDVEAKADVGSPSEEFSISTFPDDHVHYGEQIRGGTDNQDIKKTNDCPLDDKVERSMKSHTVIEESDPPSYTASPTRPRSKRVGDDDIKYVFSSSFSPPISPRHVSAAHSDIVPTNENQEIVYRSSSSPHRSFPIHSEAHQKYQISPATSERENLSGIVFQSLYQDMQQSSEGDDDSRAAVSPVELERDVVLRKSHKDAGIQASKESEKRESQDYVKTSDSVRIISGHSMAPRSVKSASDISHERKSEPPRGFYPVSSSSTTALQDAANRNRKSSPISTSKNKHFDQADGETRSTHSRKKFKDQKNEYNPDTVSINTHSHLSSINHPTRRNHDSQTVDCPEVATGEVQDSLEESQKEKDTEDNEMELSMSPSRFGNSLNSLSGWSSGIESKEGKRKQSLVEKNRGESFASMLRTYAPASSQQSNVVTLNEVIEALPCQTEDDRLDGDQKSEVSPTSHLTKVQREDSDLENFEVLKSPSEFFCGQVEANSSKMFFLFHVPRELGLSHQNFACKGCYRPIGIIYGQHRLCEFDGGLYCYDCHENSEAYLPSSILYDWDFRKKKVCRENYKFLQELEEQPLYNVEELNHKLYNHVPELGDLKLLRQQLCYLKSYLFTCSQKVAESLRQKVWPREHLYDKRDLYSVTDFLQVQSGSLQRLIKDVVKFSSQHVYDCVLCSLKGFVCEICRNPQVIYPFEVDTTVRCKSCKAVYHRTCMTESLPCPKCERWGRHFSDIEDHPEDYGMSPHA